ncbi:MAG: carbon-nitrogen hydrolase [Deltaproteobacteria bacterium]|nr:carbon-nitrogen hydrolase [Deltaproteobacteria bacterium]
MSNSASSKTQSSNSASSNTLRVGLVQMGMTADVSSNLEKAGRMIGDAARAGAEMICLPELFASPYFCTVEHAPVDYSEPIPGRTSQALSEFARKHRVVLVGGSIHEKTQETPARLFNTTVVFDEAGNDIGHYRKMHIPHDPEFYEKNYFLPGDLGYQVFSTKKANVSALICFDQWFPEAARASALLGASVLFYPTAIGTVQGIDEWEGRWQESWENSMRGHAIANSVWVCAVNRVGREGRSEFWGGSFVCDPWGKTIVRAGSGEEIVVQEINLDLGPKVSEGWGFMRNRRPTSYGLITTEIQVPK